MADSGSGSTSPLHDGSLLKYIAIGRIGRDENDNFIDEKLNIIAHSIQKEDEEGKNIKAHLRAILKKGASKILPGKRIRLRTQLSQEEEKSKKNLPEEQESLNEDKNFIVNENKPKYDVHILAETLDEDPKKIIVYFAITDADFPKYYSIALVLKNISSLVHKNSPSNEELWNAKPLTALHKSLQEGFKETLNKFRTAPLKIVTAKVDEVKSVLQDSVRKAIDGVEQLEDMEEKSDAMHESTKVFEKRGREMKNVQRSSYYKLTACIALVVIGLLLYFIIPAALKSAKGSSPSGIVPTFPPTSAPSNSTNVTVTPTTQSSR